jgi:uncharacterized protein YndB with AHSA1/START domain
MNASPPARAQFALQRIYTATIEDVWALWTSKAALESWWGPEGFDIKVLALDLRSGGELIYLMTARAPDQIAYMRQAGLPLATECRVTYTEVTPRTRLAYTTRTDFVPDLEPYDVATIVDLRAVSGRVHLTIMFDAMHDDIWTARARAGHESQLRKLDALMANNETPSPGSPPAEPATSTVNA